MKSPDEFRVLCFGFLIYSEDPTGDEDAVGVKFSREVYGYLKGQLNCLEFFYHFAVLYIY